MSDGKKIALFLNFFAPKFGQSKKSAYLCNAIGKTTG